MKWGKENEGILAYFGPLCFSTLLVSHIITRKNKDVLERNERRKLVNIESKRTGQKGKGSKETSEINKGRKEERKK
jgi:hypothetical protein